MVKLSQQQDVVLAVFTLTQCIVQSVFMDFGTVLDRDFTARPQCVRSAWEANVFTSAVYSLGASTGASVSSWLKLLLYICNHE